MDKVGIKSELKRLKAQTEGKVKPVVHYNPHPADAIREGYSAWLMGGTTDHPRLRNDGGMVQTSVVLSVEDDGCFNTLNTRYEPEVYRKSTHG